MLNLRRLEHLAVIAEEKSFLKAALRLNLTQPALTRSIQTLEAVIAKLRKRGIQVVLSEANTRVLGKLRKAGVVKAGESHAYADQLIDAVRTIQAGTPPAA